MRTILLLAALLASNAQAQRYSRTDDTTYSDNTALWVLGQVAQSRNLDTDLVESSVTYDAATATPIATHAFGALQSRDTYWPDGALRTSTDANGNVTSFNDYQRGIPQRIVLADGATKRAVVDAMGLITSVTDETGGMTCYAYDAGGRLSQTTWPSEHTPNACDTSWTPTTMRWHQSDVDRHGLGAGHWVLQVKTGAGVRNTFFDAMWRPVIEETFDENAVGDTLSQIVTRYDAAGNVAFKSYPMRGVGHHASVTQGVRSSYDALGRVVRVEQDSELGVLATTTEYLSNFTTRTTNPRGYQTLVQYLAYDQPSTEFPTGIDEPEGTSTEIHRDIFGKPIKLRRRNASGSLLVDRMHLYDVAQRLCKSIEPETGSTIYAYDAAGNMTWSASGLSLNSFMGGVQCDADRSAALASGRAIQRGYDARNRQTSLRFPDGQGDQALAYTNDGLLQDVTTWNDPNNTTPVTNTYVYNKRRLLVEEHSAQPGWYDWALLYGYDANGSLASQRYPDASTIYFDPNALGQATGVRDNAGNVFASGVQYYPNGATRQFYYGNGLLHAMEQNARQLPSRVLDNNVWDFTYAYDQNGNPTAIRDVHAVDYVYSGNRDLLYDGRDRLTNAHLHYAQGNRYTYDALDNITGHSVFVGSTATNYTYSYDASNRLTNLVDSTTGASVAGFGYDVQGNLFNKNGQTYAFDYGNRLRSVTGKEYYRYDGHGRRVLAWSPLAGSILSIYANNGQLVYDENGRTGIRTYYIYLAGSLITTREANATTVVSKYHHTDALGSPIAVTDQAGQVIDRTYWEPYGAAIDKPAYQGVGYTGHVMDGATGLTYMQQRYYDPLTMRFASVDPVAANTVTGWNFNRYNYAAGNPYKFKDPDGRIVETLWDVANVAMGAASLGRNLASGNYAGASADAGGLIVDAVATFIPGVPGGAGAAIKAARLAENARQGTRAEKAVVEAHGANVAGLRVTLEASTGQRSVADIVTKDKGVVEVKSGNAQLSPGQKAVKADVESGRLVTPRGANAEKAGLDPGKPTQMKCYDVERC